MNLLFDLDGTLADSQEGVYNSFRYALEKLGLSIPTDEELKVVIGPPLGASFPKFGVPKDKVDEALRLYRVRYNEQGGLFESRIYDGLCEVLAKLKEDGHGMYVATSKPEVTSKRILDKFGLTPYFDIVAGATFDHSRESKADVLRYLLEQVDDASSCLMIGDTEFDVEGANLLHIPCLAVSWGFGDMEKVKKLGVVGVVNTPAELYEWIKKRGC